MRIAVFSASLPGPARKPGGVDVLAHRSADELVRRGHDVTVISYSAKPAGARYRHERLRPGAFADRRMLRLALVPLLWWRARPGRFDVVHLHGDDWFFWPRSVPTVRTFHGSALQEARTATSWRRRASQYAIFMLELLSARLATANYAPSPEEGRAYGVRGVLTCGATAKDAGPVIAEPSPPAVLFVGTWEGRKRGRLLADAFRRDVRPFFPDAELWMVSDRAEPAPGVRWFENPSDDTVAELYERATVMCLPSAYEGLGIPYIEAIAAGTPVVATPNPGAEWVLENGRVGRIVAAADVGAALRELLADPQAREALAAAGRRRARDFAWDAVCAAHIAAYSDAIVDFGARRRSAGSHRSFRRRKYRSTTT